MWAKRVLIRIIVPALIGGLEAHFGRAARGSWLTPSRYDDPAAVVDSRAPCRCHTSIGNRHTGTDVPCSMTTIDPSARSFVSIGVFEASGKEILLRE